MVGLQEKIFSAGVELTPEELAAVALAEAQLRERAAREEAETKDLCVRRPDATDLDGLLARKI